ncbi:MAG: hypothetical protein IPP95_03075 [Flavobacteriales bacterium]|nr:MAG: hypothetical protein IPP95_03075 [Flavobacteriales bacterium]
MTRSNLPYHTRQMPNAAVLHSSRLSGKKKPKTADSPKGADIATGLACPGQRPGVKFLVDVVDETGETVAIATILTMVRKLDQSA